MQGGEWSLLLEDSCSLIVTLETSGDEAKLRSWFESPRTVLCELAAERAAGSALADKQTTLACFVSVGHWIKRKRNHHFELLIKDCSLHASSYVDDFIDLFSLWVQNSIYMVQV